MALQVWLPLNGDLRNLGLDDITITNQSISGFTDSGKIGKALTLLNSYYYMRIPSLINATVFSCAFWYKKNINSSYTVNWRRIVAFETQREGESNGLFRFESSYGFANYDVSVHSNGAYQICPSSTGNRSLVADGSDWHHIAVVVSGEKISFYVDGNMVNTGDQTTGSLTGLVSICQTNNQADGWLNDLRIYDHALSQKEIKLLSQGLIAHYPLNDGIGGDNLIINTWEMPNQVFNGYALADYSFTEHLVSGQKYTITARIRMSEDKKSVLCYHSGGSYNMGGPWAVRKGEDEIYSWTFTATDTMASQTSKLGYGYLRIYVSNNQGTQGSTPITGSAYCHWIKIEKGEKSTPWVPNKQDALYLALGLNDGVVHDCSGYGYDGNVTGNLTPDSNTPRYNVSYLFDDGLADNIIATIVPPNDAITMACWIKTTGTVPKGGYHMPLNIDGGQFEFSIPSAGQFRQGFYINGVRSVANVGTSGQLTDQKWHHIAATFDGSSIKRYIDGELVNTTDVSGTLSGGVSRKIYIGRYGTSTNYASMKLLESDVRIYATALSADDIQNLYKTTASIDDHSNVYGYELQEENKPYYRQLIDINRLENGGNYKGTVIAESDGVHLNNIVWAIDSSFNNGHGTGFIDVDPDNYWYLMSWTYTNTANNWFLIGVERYDENYTSTSNSSCLYTINTSSAVTRASSSQAIDITKDSNGNPVKHIKLRVLNNWNNTADIEGTAIIHKLTLMEIPKN